MTQTQFSPQQIIVFQAYFRNIAYFAALAGQSADKLLSASLLNLFEEEDPRKALLNHSEALALGEIPALGNTHLVTEKENLEANKPALLKALFSELSLGDSDKKSSKPCYYYSPKPLSPTTLFPRDKASINPNYQSLWLAFKKDFAHWLETFHPNNQTALDSLDTLWQTYAHAIPRPSSLKEESVSLYDHSKAVVAFAVALEGWYQEKNIPFSEGVVEKTEKEKSLLLIQGDFFGIQNFIFASGSQTQKSAAKLLRGRSFQVSLFAELAALTILEKCRLPATSQIMNAAGKLMILAPNTKTTHQGLKEARQIINQWFLDHTFGQVAMGVSLQELTPLDFTDQAFGRLIKDAFEALEMSKYQQFDLTQEGHGPVLNITYEDGVCQFNSSFPANTTGKSKGEGESKVSYFSLDQITLGEGLTKKEYLCITSEAVATSSTDTPLRQSIFGWQVALSDKESLKTGSLSKMTRLWDFKLPTFEQESLWQGAAFRPINAYVPKFKDMAEMHSSRYKNFANPEDLSKGDHPLKTFSHLACEDRKEERENEFIGKIALAVLKGDVDNLGAIFQQGSQPPSLAKTMALSRYMTQFFSLWLPAFCADKYKNTYTVFAGGDDFFMIGPWHQTQKLALEMREAFSDYVAHNPEITFSAGIYIAPKDLPIARLSDYAEEALEKAKAYDNQETKETKNAITLYDETVSWEHFEALLAEDKRIAELRKDYTLSTGYIYGMIHLVDLKNNKNNIESALWLSRLRYRTRRMVNDSPKIKLEQRSSAYQAIVQPFEIMISQYDQTYKIPLFNYFYQYRER